MAAGHAPPSQGETTSTTRPSPTVSLQRAPVCTGCVPVAAPTDFRGRSRRKGSPMPTAARATAGDATDPRSSTGTRPAAERTLPAMADPGEWPDTLDALVAAPGNHRLL